MTQDQAINRAREFLDREKIEQDGFLGARPIKRNQRDQWAVLFRLRKPKGFEKMLEDRLIVIVDNDTNDVSILPSL
jgi:hypothetical protein